MARLLSLSQAFPVENFLICKYGKRPLAGNLSVACFYKLKEMNETCWFLEFAPILHSLP